MQVNQKDNYEKPVAFISKWALVVIVLAPYLYIQIKILIGVLSQNFDDKGCGMRLIGALLFPLILAAIAAIILVLKMYLGKGFKSKQKLIIFLIIFVPPVISLLALLNFL